MFFCFTEHWVSYNDINTIQIPSFYLAGSYCRTRESNTSPAYGGSCIYVRNYIDSTFLSEFNLYAVEKVFETTVIHLTTFKIILLCIYRPTKRALDYFTFLENQEIILNKISNLSLNSIVVCGDFNIHFLSEFHKKEQLLNLLHSFNLDITVNVPTQNTLKLQKALDQIIINKTTTTYEIITNNLGYSDHDAQILTITKNINTDTINNTRMCRAFTKVNIKLFTDYLVNESWDTVYNAVDTNEKYNLFLSKLSIHFNACFPLKKRKLNISSKCNTWITQEISTSCKNKRTLYFISKHHNVSHGFHVYFREYKRILEKVIVQAKIMKNSQDIFIASNKTKAMWDIVKNTTTSSRYLVENVILKDNERETSNPEKVANLFNKHFCKIASDLTKGLKPKIQHHTLPKKFPIQCLFPKLLSTKSSE